jgi:hypothetical protein
LLHVSNKCLFESCPDLDLPNTRLYQRVLICDPSHFPEVSRAYRRCAYNAADACGIRVPRGNNNPRHLEK